MIFYKNNKIENKKEISPEEIAKSFLENGNYEYRNIAYYGLYPVIHQYAISTFGSIADDTQKERDAATADLGDAYQKVKDSLKDNKLSLWGPEPAR